MVVKSGGPHHGFGGSWDTAAVLVVLARLEECQHRTRVSFDTAGLISVGRS